ncbi:ImuA family protein [Aestuariivita boseongensis]|uniref:ImuA family protein n=1 Tax=Aestuariivita boseongensis TaxID=1470562 RepID=UPI000680B12B|nr:hypothetical protein [Aestuariivita boseongensis]
MPAQLLPHPGGQPPDRPALTLAEDIAIPLARLSEVCGASRRSFAIWLARATKGPVIWISPSWEPDQLHAEGIRDFTDPGRFLFIRPKRPEDILWSLEEVLRSGAVALVVGDLPGLPGLTAVRRMHLAAETGAAEGAHSPIGLILTPGEGGAQGIETRWRMTPRHAGNLRRWQLSRLRARTRPPKDWMIAQDRPGAAPYSLSERALQESV